MLFRSEVQDEVGLHQSEQGGFPHLSRAQQEHTAWSGPEAGHEQPFEHARIIPGILHTHKNYILRCCGPSHFEFPRSLGVARRAYLGGQ